MKEGGWRGGGGGEEGKSEKSKSGGMGLSDGVVFQVQNLGPLTYPPNYYYYSVLFSFSSFFFFFSFLFFSEYEASQSLNSTITSILLFFKLPSHHALRRRKEIGTYLSYHELPTYLPSYLAT